MGIQHYLGYKRTTSFCVSVLFLSTICTKHQEKFLGRKNQTEKQKFFNKNCSMRPVICREYKKIQLSLVPRTVPVVMKTLHRAEKLLKDETPEGDKSLGDTMGKRFGEDEG